MEYINNNYRTAYWLYCQFGGKRKWETLSHNGVLFPPEYEPHNIPIQYNGKAIKLPKLAEEYATLYAKYLDTEYIKNKTFNKNFWKDWKPEVKDLGIESLENCDFTDIANYLKQQRERRLSISKDEKLQSSEERKLGENKYSIAIVNGKQQPVGNYRMEPPGIFLGRGEHPKVGRIKRRIYPEDITLNIGKEAKIPEPLPGHKWGEIIHDKNVEWLASWKDVITGKFKYVWLGAHSELRGKSDIEKFDKARKLKRKIKQIRDENNKNMENNNNKLKQIATALYFIDNLALRAGNEKGDDQADTVGVTSLRIEHIKLLENNQVQLDFLGKDSVRYRNKVKVSDLVYQNIIKLSENKNKDDMLFDLITPNDVNKYLQSFMKDLTSKVFRTFNASYTFYKELKKITQKMESYDKPDKMNIILDMFNSANAKVAILCNHQKNVSKSFGTQIEKINQQMKTIKSKLKSSKIKGDKKKKLKDKLNKLKSKKKLRTELKDISLSTSRVNYIDPRLSVAFLKKHDIPIEKIFSKTLQDKFNWAMDTSPDWKY